jgi:uncharacterized protein YcgI (DUF1989 family)
MATVELYETQLSFLDRVVAEGEHGADREEVLKRLLLDHVSDRVGGAGEYVGGTAQLDVLETAYPEYGPKRYEHVLEPVTGKAIPVMKGEVLRIEQVVGGTCVDFNAFNLHDYKEALDCGFTRSFQSFDPKTGEFIWTNAPRGRPMFGILHIEDTCELDIVGHRCNRVFEELGWGLTDHANCQDTLAESIREYGLTPDDVHDSFNLWMATTIDPSGRRQFKWNPAPQGDRIDLLAMFDVLAASVICGIGDLVGINNYGFEPIKLEVYERSEATTALVADVEARWGSMKSQTRSEDLSGVPVLAQRALERKPDYEAHFRPAPNKVPVELELGPEEQRITAGLVATGVYGRTEGEAVRAAFMRWCNSHVTRVRRPLVRFASA